MKKLEKKNVQDQLSAVLKPYQTLVVVGGNWGDEGKGKIIDLIMSHYDIVARFSGGANAGHTVYAPNGAKIVGHLIPCGLAQNKECILGRGEFIDLRLFIEELEAAQKVLGTSLPKVWIDEQSSLWTPWHPLLEGWLESLKGKNKVGTTGKGIGPLAGLYKLRIAPVVGHLLSGKEKLTATLEILYSALMPIFKEMKAQGLMQEAIPAPEEVADQLLGHLEEVKGRIADTSYLLSQALQKGQRILFEGAQALGLDSHWGTYPFVSCGDSAAAGAAIGTGLPMDTFVATVMVAKILPTRVGRGPFLSEMWERKQAEEFAKENSDLFSDKQKKEEFLKERLEKINSGKATYPEWSQYFQVLGDERGATTGRGRSVGFLDIPWLLYAIRINHPKFIALTRFDMLSGLKSVPVVTGYKYQGQILPPGKLPPTWQLEEIEILKEDWPCWEEDISGCQDERDLPDSARSFLKLLEEKIGVPILLTGTGPERDAIVIRAGQKV